MRRTKIWRSLFAVLLAMAMLLPTMPGAHAADESACDVCGTVCSKIVLKQANCHEPGVVEYICVNSKCTAYKVSVLAKTDIDPNRHDTICTDNEDGATHTAYCIYHAEYVNTSEEHSFVNAYCTKCAAADYSQAEIAIADKIELYVDLGDAQTSISVGNVAVMVGHVDVSKEYIISYSWADRSGTVVGTGENFRMAAADITTEGDYVYGCYIMAMPKSGSAAKYITASCMVTVHVRDMLSVGAVVGSRDTSFTLSKTNNATENSVFQQIYTAVYGASEGTASYVVFEQAPQSDVGQLVVDGASRYYFTAKDNQKKLSEVKFIPSDTAAGIYTIRFTAYDTKGKGFPGVLTIYVERELGAMDVTYYSAQGEKIDLSGEDFARFWQEKYPGGTLQQMSFAKLPAASEGLFYYNYNASLVENTLIRENDKFYLVLSNVNQYLIDGVSFIPAEKYSGQIVVPFTMQGLNSKASVVQTSGELSIFVCPNGIETVEVNMTNGTAQPFSAEDFMTVYKNATGKEDGMFSIRLLDVPENGELYMDYTGAENDAALTAENVADYTFYYNSELSREIEDLVYVSNKSLKTLTDTLRYLLCDEQGEFLYMGEIVFTCERGEVVYTKSFTDVSVDDLSTAWYYTQLMDLAELGIINGYEEKVNGESVFSYKPYNYVTYGEALRMIMEAVGYEKQAQTDPSHWASGYLDKAIEDRLVSSALTYKRLGEVIPRRMVAQIVARAMKLPTSTRTESPFTDVDIPQPGAQDTKSIYAGYILSVYDAGIMLGNTDGTFGYDFNEKEGKGVFTRAQMAVTIWRIYNYEG